MKYLKLFENFDNSDIEAIAKSIIPDLQNEIKKSAVFTQNHFYKFMNLKGIKNVETINSVAEYLMSKGIPIEKDYDDIDEKDYGIVADIANSIIDDLKMLKKEKGLFTYEDFEKWMQERGASSEIISSVANFLVGKGFDFDSEPEDDIPSDYEMKLEKYQFN